MTAVNIPEVGVVNFPDEMSPEDIQRAIETDIMKQPATAGSRAMTTAAGANKGIAGLLGLPVDTGENLINLGLTGYGVAKNVITGRADTPPALEGSFLGSQHIEGLMNKGGVQTTNPNPEDTASRMLHTGGIIAGGSLFPGARPIPTLTAATGGAVASEIDPRLTALGAIAPGATRAAVNELRRPLANKVAANVAPFQKIGAEPTVGMATGNSFFSGLENLVSKFPGGAGVMGKHAARLQQQVGASAKTGVSAEDAGRAIERGVTGPGGFIERTRTVWQNLDNAVAAKVPKGTAVTPFHTTDALDRLTKPVPGAPTSTAGLANPKLVQLREDIATDLQANKGTMPFEALRALRTRVGSMLDDSLISGVPNGELKQVYAGLSRDMELTAGNVGAGQAFARQNQYYAARQARIENVLDRVLGKGKQPEDVFKTFYPKDPDQANKVRATLRSLPPADRKIVTNAVVARLGRASPGKQDEFGEVFSSEVFLTNWNKLSPGAKAQLFPEAHVRRNIESIAELSAKIRGGAGSYANPSGTAGSFAAYSIYLSPVVSVGTGTLTPVVAAAGAATAANIGAKMLTSPRVIAWMANAPTGNPKAVAAHLARLSVIYNSTDDEGLKSELEDYVKSMGGK